MAASLHLSNRCCSCMQRGNQEVHGFPARLRSSQRASASCSKKYTSFFFCFVSNFLPKSCARWTGNKEFTWCSLTYLTKACIHLSNNADSSVCSIISWFKSSQSLISSCLSQDTYNLHVAPSLPPLPPPPYTHTNLVHAYKFTQRKSKYGILL